MLDPHTAAELSLDEIRSLVDDLLDAHGHWIPPAGYERSGPVTRTGPARGRGERASDRRAADFAARPAAARPHRHAAAPRARRRLGHPALRRGGGRSRTSQRARPRSAGDPPRLDRRHGRPRPRRVRPVVPPAPPAPGPLATHRRSAPQAGQRCRPSTSTASARSTSSRTATTGSRSPARGGTRTSRRESMEVRTKIGAGAQLRLRDLPLKRARAHLPRARPTAAAARARSSSPTSGATRSSPRSSRPGGCAPATSASGCSRAREMIAHLVPRGVRAGGRRCCARPGSAATAPRPSATCASRCSASSCCRPTSGPRTSSSDCSARSDPAQPARGHDGAPDPH